MGHTCILFICIFYIKIVNPDCSLATAHELFLTKYHLHYQKYFFNFITSSFTLFSFPVSDIYRTIQNEIFLLYKPTNLSITYLQII